jgi:hypothetical protein
MYTALGIILHPAGRVSAFIGCSKMRRDGNMKSTMATLEPRLIEEIEQLFATYNRARVKKLYRWSGKRGTRQLVANSDRSRKLR